MADHDVLGGFSPAVREWFAASFPEPTAPQQQGWPAIRGGAHTLVCAPTGSGKTLTAFLASLDRLVVPPPADEPVVDPAARTRVLYLSPLRALAFDVEKNLRAPLVGIGLAAERQRKMNAVHNTKPRAMAPSVPLSRQPHTSLCEMPSTTSATPEKPSAALV